MFAAAIMEQYSMFLHPIAQYYSGRRGIGMKNKYARSRRYRKQPQAAPFEHTRLFH
jgi:hypothetical protein